MASEDDSTKDIQIDKKWTEIKEDEIYAPWEELVAAILTEDITERLC